MAVNVDESRRDNSAVDFEPGEGGAPSRRTEFEPTSVDDDVEILWLAARAVDHESACD
jgi:hypothetical protein